MRVERLYPFPTDELQPVLERYSKIESFAWVQEEPRNMGARKFVLPRIRHLVPYRIPLGDISRPERSRPAEGYPAAHAVEQARIVREAFTSGLARRPTVCAVRAGRPCASRLALAREHTSIRVFSPTSSASAANGVPNAPTNARASRSSRAARSPARRRSASAPCGVTRRYSPRPMKFVK